jgi:hypothetical protein
VQPANDLRQTGEASRLEPWPRLFPNLRSSRKTERLKEFPVHVVALRRSA